MSRGILVAVVAWLAVVVAGSTMTWTAINTAGQQVLSPGAVSTPIADRAAPAAPVREATLPAGRPDPSSRRASPDRSPSPPKATKAPASSEPQPPRQSGAPGSPRPERSSEPQPSLARSPEPSSPKPHKAPAAPTAPAPVPEPAPAPAAPPQPSTWRGVAGAVTVSCSGGSVALQAASPSNGYAVDVRERGPEEVEVRLESDDAETRVEAVCDAGTARFSVDEDG